MKETTETKKDRKESEDTSKKEVYTKPLILEEVPIQSMSLGTPIPGPLGC